MKLKVKVKGSVRPIEIPPDATIQQLKDAIVQKDDPFTISRIVAAGKELKDDFIVGTVLKPNTAVLATHVDRPVISRPQGEPFFLAHDILVCHLNTSCWSLFCLVLLQYSVRIRHVCTLAGLPLRESYSGLWTSANFD